ncbi:3-demethylubiquinone-9 3-methyltransferase [Smithella sp. ME-1]|uniref:3-demethylubiquinol 3-o-methyltransferase n=1 Tax=hydrocarbon metagenome TaxID=938273 RepID=A0A0W8FQ03_9ZZZZ|nr:3-demethylubiquinone-9 3-methyltransferase [Smithella sp. ME-1]
MRKWLPTELEEIVCDYCGSKNVAREFMRGDGMRVVECAECGLAFLNPRPKAEYIPLFYEKDYFTGVSIEKGLGGLCLERGLEEQNNKSQLMPRSIMLIKEIFGTLKNLKILEIGCASGDLLSFIKDEGAFVKGLEISDFAAELARKRGLDVATGTIESFIIETSEAFDVVIAMEVIEHIQKPTEFISLVEKLIKPGGVLLLSTPNYFCTNCYGRKWFGFNASYEHIYYFSLKVLDKIASKCGLKITYNETSWFLGGPKESATFIGRQIEKIIFSWETLKHYSLCDVIKLKPFKYGHTMIVVMSKNYVL